MDEQTRVQIDTVLNALSRSDFRRRFRLSAADRDYIARKGLPTVARHGRDFIAQRLAPAEPPHDGRQTPMRGHPVFVAQHATATCCRNCLAKWHHIPPHRALTRAEQDYILRVIGVWIQRQLKG